MSPAVHMKPVWKLIDWRLVAACGLPIWAFVLGIAISHRPARGVWVPPLEPAANTIPEPVGLAQAPMPREIVVRDGETQVIAVPPPVPASQVLRGSARQTGAQGQVHVLLAHAPLPKLAQLYPIVFETILGEKLSTLPVQSR